MQRHILCIVILMWCTLSLGQQALLSGLIIKAGVKGLAVALETDEPAVESFQKSIQGKNSFLEITLRNVAYGLEEFSYNEFPSESPVKKIVTRELANGTLSIEFTFKNIYSDKIQAKRVKNRSIFMLSFSACPEFSWEKIAAANPPALVQEPSVSSSASVPNQPPATVTSIRMLKRGAIEQCIITADAPVRIATDEKNNSIIAVFENARNGLKTNRITIPHSTIFNNIQVKESVRDGITRVGVIITTSTTSARCFVQAGSRQCTILAADPQMSGPQSISGWSSDGRLDYSYTFNTSSLTEDITKASVTPVPAVPQQLQKQKPRRYVVVRKDVNVRSQPSAGSSDNIIAKYSLGVKGTMISKEGIWYKVRFDEAGVEGWINSTMIAESSAVTHAQWKMITAARKNSRPESENVADVVERVPVAAPQEIPADKVATVAATDQVADSALQPEAGRAKRLSRYRVYGRDPFIPLNQFDILESELIKAESSTLVGLLYHPNDRVALVEDATKSGEAYALRENDAISKGRVIKILPDEVVFLLNEAGFSRKFVLKLNPKKEK